MALSENALSKEPPLDFVKNSRILSTSENTVTVATEAGRQTLSLVCPYGISSVPPNGSEAFYLDCPPTGACIGVAVLPGAPEAGEILLKSAGGAFILLKNNGEIILNGLVISPNGTI